MMLLVWLVFSCLIFFRLKRKNPTKPKPRCVSSILRKYSLSCLHWEYSSMKITLEAIVHMEAGAGAISPKGTVN